MPGYRRNVDPFLSDDEKNDSSTNNSKEKRERINNPKRRDGRYDSHTASSSSPTRPSQTYTSIPRRHERTRDAEGYDIQVKNARGDERIDDEEYRRRRAYYRDSPGNSPVKEQDERRYSSKLERDERRDRKKDHGERTRLSAGKLAALDKLNQGRDWNVGSYKIQRDVKDDEEEGDVSEFERERRRRKEERREKRRLERLERERRDDEVVEVEVYTRREKRDRGRCDDGYEVVDEKRRVISGQKLEKNGYNQLPSERRGFEFMNWFRRRKSPMENQSDASRGDEYRQTSEKKDLTQKKRKKSRLICLIILILILIIIIPVAIVLSKKKTNTTSTSTKGSSSSNGQPSNSNLAGLDPNSVPTSDKNTWLDPFSWYDTNDFNVTITNVMIGNLPIIGLNSTWDDSTQANSNVPALHDPWNYGVMPIRGINVGGWFVLEPVITPSYFNQYKSSQGVIDEYTLASTLSPATVKGTFEKHYSTFITKQDFIDMQNAGFDHVRIPFGYWMVETYPGDPYVAQVSWRYLLRAIEWARQCGLRINLDLHGAPGSQNGWNHSGRQGAIGWLHGTDGALNAQRTIDIHDRLSKFFAQPRYKNIITIYGLVNEPRMTSLDVKVVNNWTVQAISTIRGNGIKNAIISIGDGFLGLDHWQGLFQDLPNLIIDVHQYVIFATGTLTLAHTAKMTFACGAWSAQTLRSLNKATGFGPTMVGEWSQADTDCATYLNNVGVGSRWEGTLNMFDGPGGSTSGSVLTPTCPTMNNPRCSCDDANADPNTYTAEYKQWLRDYAEAQMHSFEQGWGWFYWTWKTESNTQWSYSDGMAAGILPQKTWQRSFSCNDTVPDYAGLGLPEYY